MPVWLWIVLTIVLVVLFIRAWRALNERYALPEVPVPGRPVRTEEMRRMGLTWAKTTEGEYIEVCDTCGGNCGQCGITGRVGNVAVDMNNLIKATGMNNPVAGFPRPR